MLLRVLERVLALVQQLLVPQQQVLVQARFRRRNLWLQWRVSSWHHASTDL